MCTAISFNSGDFYFGRTLDYDASFGEKVVITPCNYPFSFRFTNTLLSHYAIIGVACVADNYPLYYDAVNEKGLAMAGLNFVGNAHYNDIIGDKINVAQFELIPYILSQCSSVDDAQKLLTQINITPTPFNSTLPCAQLHWIVADSDKSITIEAVKDGLKIYDNPAGVLTNNPPFNQQLFALNNYMHLSNKEPQNNFSKSLPLSVYSRGMGALGLPGDLSSQSRFVRATFTKTYACPENTEEESVSQFFHILGVVEQTKGCCLLDNGKHEMTLYTSCANATRGIYYYKTYYNNQICAVDMNNENLDTSMLIQYPLINKQQIYHHN